MRNGATQDDLTAPGSTGLWPRCCREPGPQAVHPAQVTSAQWQGTAARDLRPWRHRRPGRKVGSWPPEDIAKLQAQIDDLHAQQVGLRKQLAKAQLDQWQARFENPEVQMHLEAKEATDKAYALMDQLRAKWAEARRQFEESISTASSVADTVRTGLEKAYDDLRKALLESKDELASKNNPA